MMKYSNCFRQDTAVQNMRQFDLLPYCSSVNISCGLHSGDPSTINNILKLLSTKDEIANVIEIGKHHKLEIILQPVTNKNIISSDMNKLFEIFKIFYSLYPNTRLIPQVHKFLKVQ